jgi:hypothetical protein
MNVLKDMFERTKEVYADQRRVVVNSVEGYHETVYMDNGVCYVVPFCSGCVGVLTPVGALKYQKKSDVNFFRMSSVRGTPKVYDFCSHKFDGVVAKELDLALVTKDGDYLKEFAEDNHLNFGNPKLKEAFGKFGEKK